MNKQEVREHNTRAVQAFVRQGAVAIGLHAILFSAAIMFEADKLGKIGVVTLFGSLFVLLLITGAKLKEADDE